MEKEFFHSRSKNSCVLYGNNQFDEEVNATKFLACVSNVYLKLLMQILTESIELQTIFY